MQLSGLLGAHLSIHAPKCHCWACYFNLWLSMQWSEADVVQTLRSTVAVLVPLGTALSPKLRGGSGSQEGLCIACCSCLLWDPSDGKCNGNVGCC